MKNTMVYKIITFMIIFAIIIMANPMKSMATHTPAEIISEADDFIAEGKKGEIIGNISQQSLKNMSDTIYNILLGLGIIVAVVVASMLGIKFMTGSVEEQAKVKESLIPFIIGCVVVFGAFGIWKVAVNLLSGIS